MKKKEIKIGFVGAGWAMQKHLEVFSVLGDVKRVGITSRTRLKAESLAKTFLIEGCYDSLEEMVHEAKPDALFIAVKEDQGFSVVSSALKFGLPLFTEKPAGLTLEEGRQLALLAKDKGVMSMVGLNRRYYSIFHKGLEIIRQHGPLLGLAVEGHERMWRVREGKQFSQEILSQWLYANSIHTIDLLPFFGGEIEDIKTFSRRQLKESHGDQFVASMSFISGALGQYQAHWYSPGGWKVMLYGQGVTVEFKPLEEGRFIDKDFKVHPILPDDVDVKFKPGFYRQAEAFINMVRTGTRQWPAVGLEDAYQTMALVEGMSCV